MLLCCLKRCVLPSPFSTHEHLMHGKTPLILPNVAVLCSHRPSCAPRPPTAAPEPSGGPSSSSSSPVDRHVAGQAGGPSTTGHGLRRACHTLFPTSIFSITWRILFPQADYVVSNIRRAEADVAGTPKYCRAMTMKAGNFISFNTRARTHTHTHITTSPGH